MDVFGCFWVRLMDLDAPVAASQAQPPGLLDLPA
jgi:hypothetical protein